MKSHFWRKNVIILLLCTQRCYGRHNVSRKSIKISGLSILMHGVILLSDATSYDNIVSCTSAHVLFEFIEQAGKKAIKCNTHLLNMFSLFPNMFNEFNDT